MTAPMTSREELLAEALEDCLREHGGFTIKGECERKARAALAIPAPAQGWQEPAANWLERKADLITNSLHCGDSSMTIHFTHKHADTLRALAKEIRASSSPPSTGLPAPAPHAEQHAMLANAIRSGELELVFCHPTGKFPALGASQEQRNIVEAALRSPAPHAEVREATIEECARVVEHWSLPTIQTPSMWLVDKAGIAAEIRDLKDSPLPTTKSGGGK